ncbi:hypothetical protein BI364_11905 [Acidihalobacter yilgarnensis]|uniref:Methylated-DNA-[protein]-cysteine S-methyltransferase DNA binding domain-containing protein n=1 Tax=Acidihalobacter yilgarnensis TaxID=2819280 RepID=A0A1D8IQ60_9GAMM|nr:hypothetical protein BI364_11905 [Acidihalobacter yilgarnensis]
MSARKKSERKTSNLVGALTLPWGRLGIYARGGDLWGCDWLGDDALPAEGAEDELLAVCREEMHVYLRAPAHRFGLPLPETGSAFQRRVWHALRDIPAGEVRTYGALAHELGSGPRAVAQACRANPWTLIVPCHRVVAANGWGGYAGAVDGRLLEIKRGLLAHEGVAALI